MQYGQRVLDDGFPTQSQIVATYKVLTHHAGSNAKYGRGGVSTSTVLFGKPVEGSHANINEGELVFTCRGIGRGDGQYDQVFSNLASVGIPNSFDDIEKQKRDIYAKVQCVGVSTNTITFGEYTNPSAASLAVHVGGGITIRHSGKFPITPRSHVFWFIPDAPDVPGVVKPELRSIEQGDIKTLAKSFDFTDVLESEPFHRCQKATIQYTLDIGSYILRHPDELNAMFGEQETDACSRYLTGTNDTGTRMPPRFNDFIRHVVEQLNDKEEWNKVNGDVSTIIAESMTQDLKDHPEKKDSFMASVLPFCASALSIVYSRMVGTSADYQDKLTQFYAYVNPAASSLVEKFTY